MAQPHQGNPQRLDAEAAVLAAIFILGYVEMKIQQIPHGKWA